MKTLLLGLAALCLDAQSLPIRAPLADAHNCYPEDGRWTDRLERALKTGFPIAIEQDIAWSADRTTPVLSHRRAARGGEPALRDHFFERVRPLVQRALEENRPETWPLIVLHFDFKDNDPALLRAVWDLLSNYESWISTAPQTADPAEVASIDVRPLLVMSEDDPAQEEVFFRSLPAGARLRIFGSARTSEPPVRDGRRADYERIRASMTPASMLTVKPNNFRRWWNLSWGRVEQGGPAKAGAWTPKENRRLKALVDHAHRMGFAVRFYTLDGFAPDRNQGWTQAYNFGSLESARIRWCAAIDAGVDLISSDHYEDLAAEVNARRKR